MEYPFVYHLRKYEQNFFPIIIIFSLFYDNERHKTLNA